MSYLTIHSAANDADFQARCRVATWKAAQDIAGEDPATPNHQMRIDWSTRILQGRANISGLQLAMQVLRNSVVAADPAVAADDAIQFQVNSVLGAIIAIG